MTEEPEVLREGIQLVNAEVTILAQAPLHETQCCCPSLKSTVEDSVAPACRSIDKGGPVSEIVTIGLLEWANLSQESNAAQLSPHAVPLSREIGGPGRAGAQQLGNHPIESRLQVSEADGTGPDGG